MISNTSLITPTKCTTFFNYIHLLCFSCVLRCYLHLHQEELCVLYLKPHTVTQLLSVVIAAYRHVVLGVSNTETGRIDTVNVCS